MDAKICDRCKAEKPLSAFSRHANARDGYRRACRACVSVGKARTPRRSTSRKPYVPPPIPAQPSIPAPGPFPDLDPWKYAPRIGPFMVTLAGARGGLTYATDFPACSRACANRVLAERVPPVYREVCHDTRGHGHRAVPRPVRAVVGPLTRDGTCAACSAQVRVTPRPALV